MTYLDNAATTIQKPGEVYKRLETAARTLGSPGRGGHAYSMNAARTAYECREEAARLFNVPEPDNVVFTLNATHALNIAIFSIVKPDMRVVVTGYEHNSVMRPLRAIGARTDVAESKLFSRESAIDAFKTRLNNGVNAVVMTHVSNVFGYIIPVEEIAQMCRERKIPFIIDASQSAGCLNIDFAGLGAEFIAMPGHKGLYGPQGTGLLLCGSKASPFMYGGSGSNSALPTMPDFLPDMLEAGTHNMPGISGLLAGLKFVNGKGTERILAHEKRLTKMMAEGLGRLDEFEVFRDETLDNQSGVLSFNLKGVSPEAAAELFAKQGIALRAGLHCAPYAHRTAGTFPEGTVRASVSAFTSERDVKTFLNTASNIALTTRKNKI